MLIRGPNHPELRGTYLLLGRAGTQSLLDFWVTYMYPSLESSIHFPSRTYRHTSSNESSKRNEGLSFHNVAALFLPREGAQCLLELRGKHLLMSPPMRIGA